MNVSDNRLCQFVFVVSALTLGTALLMFHFGRQRQSPETREQAHCVCKAPNCQCTDCQCRKPGHPELRHGCCAGCECNKVQAPVALDEPTPEDLDHARESFEHCPAEVKHIWREGDLLLRFDRVVGPPLDGVDGPPHPVPDIEPGTGGPSRPRVMEPRISREYFWVSRDPLPRVINGEIKSVDTANRRLLVKEGEELNPIFTTNDTLIYRGKRTLFFEDLSKGQHVSIQVKMVLGSSDLIAISITVLERSP